ncbi:MAG: peptidase M48 [Rhodobacterales bacterium]|nr:peptidase M48 [Rhodobacterales bacterium]
MLLKILPIILPVIIAIITFKFSAKSTIRNLKKSSSKLNEPQLIALIQRMAKEINLNNINVYVYKIGQINGIASPDGKIYLTEGFLNAYYSGKVTASELSTVVAHELGHLALGHTKKRIIDFSGQTAIRIGLGFILGRFLPGVGLYLANALAQLISAKLSRTDEYAADAYAAALLKKSNIGTEPQISLLNKLDYLLNSNELPQIPWLMSHPSSKDRISEIAKLEQKWTKNIP